MGESVLHDAENSAITGSLSRLPSLDGWRGVAIILVLLSHWWATDGAGHLPGWITPFTKNGDLGVRIFLTLSGFLITNLLLSENLRKGTISLPRFYARRALRIFPVYFAFLSVLFTLTLLGIYEDEASTWIGSLTFTRNFIGRGDSATGHLWSLAVEEQFYLLWPLAMVVFKLASRPQLAIFALLGAAIAAFVLRAISCTGDDHLICLRILGPKSLFLYMDSLGLGCVGAFVLVYLRYWVESAAFLAFTPCLLLFVFSALLSPANSIEMSGLILLQATLVSLCLMFSIVSKQNIIFVILNMSAMNVLGVLSYSIYIWHTLFLSHYMKFTNPIFVYDWRLWFVAAFSLAACSYYLFERPLLRLRGYFRR